jgi:PilZ domain-containing protein
MASQEPPNSPSGKSASPSPASERRRFPRAVADWPLTIALTTGKPTESAARVRDVSRGGVCFYFDRPLALMTLLELQLDLPVPHGVRHVKGKGAVVRCERIGKGVDHFEIAVFLHELSDHDRNAIDEYVRGKVAARA